LGRVQAGFSLLVAVVHGPKHPVIQGIQADSNPVQPRIF
jgi:hypothetical protein